MIPSMMHHHTPACGNGCRTGSFKVAERLVPPQPQEAEALTRAQLLLDTLQVG
jgi:hypothetical protein